MAIPFEGVFTTLLLFILGTLIGSFLNVLSLRYDPDKFLIHKNVIGGRSHCPHCKRTLRWYELVPLFSFVFQGGRCRTCHARLTLQYPIVELLAGLLVAFVPGQIAMTFNHFLVLGQDELLALQIVWILAFLSLLLMSAIDFRLRLIPDELNIFIGILGVIATLVSMHAFGQVDGSFVGHYAALFGV